MTIKERLVNCKEEDLIYFGNLMASFKATEAFEYIQEIIQNKEFLETLQPTIVYKDNEPSSDKVLGRLQGMLTILNLIDEAIRERDYILKNKELNKEIKKEKETTIHPDPYTT